MGLATHQKIHLQDDFRLTHHAWERMNGRGFSPEAIRQVLSYGRAAYTRGATIYAVGRKEVDRFRKDGVVLDSVEGVQVVCGDHGSVLTVYRNRDFRSLRPRSRRAHRQFH